ncbi:hypothetical protein [Paenibacillus macquariensis]|uniref:Tissue inhibitor of metalloproteinase n=1 Tax=Paenibacillus macquariensis TaxID=948756 RepID=A0ABY1KAQ0_9BACL|nr:hypothetical protein [Paenibacillus macquariensis]MEC0089461.1 hypothetical protein [Paenibacillus macquariensis]OAB25857.1 hypothetical protein PMSM_28250 [Paenibacillus macquariensis subsp. macquariensis]SIR52345.1 hypothetical protein SAMN05421578_11713 [Paenibacillus macquariensis]
MKKGIVLALVSILIVLMISPTTTHALKCVEMPTGEQGYEEYDGIIVGHVEDVVRKKDNNMIKLKVSKSFKKISEEQILVKENITWGSLRGPSEIGEEYLYYLRESESGWENPLCSPTMKVAEAANELTFLQDKEIVINRISTPTQSPSDDNEVSELSSDEKTNHVSNATGSISKYFSSNSTEIVISVGVLGGILYALWCLWRARK